MNAVDTLISVVYRLLVFIYCYSALILSIMIWVFFNH